MTKNNITLGESVVKIKNICNSLNYNYLMTNHAYAIDKLTRLSDIINKMEIPELIGESSEEKKYHIEA